MKEIAKYISEGAMAFLKAEYKILTYFVIIASLLLGFMGATNVNVSLDDCCSLYYRGFL